MEYTSKSADELYELARQILLAAGADERNADGVAEHLVSANLSGVDTHGVRHLPFYVEEIRAGAIVPTTWPTIVNESPNAALVTGNWTFGQVTAKYAMEVAIGKAREHDLALVGIVQTHHIGRLGHYVEMAAASQMLSMVWAGGFGKEAPAAVPYGGRTPVLHTNPVAMGFPAGEERPMTFDFATAALSGVKVTNAYRRHEQLPPGCIVDKDGNPTTDPNDFFAGGAHAPFGGHKGYALMMAAEVLGRVLSGSDAFAEADRGGAVMRHQGVAMMVFRADLFQPFADYGRRMDELQRRVRAVPPAPGFKEVLIPGDPEARARVVRQRDGIPVAADVWESLTDLAAALDVRV